MKVRIPQEHYELYRTTYRYLQDCPETELDGCPNWDLAKHLIANYLDRHRKNKPLTHLLENDHGNTASDSTPKEPPISRRKTTSKEEETSLSTPIMNKPMKRQGRPLPTKPELEKLHQVISQCQNCFLGKLRKQYVKLPSFPRYPIMAMVDVPSFYDQTQGQYFMDDAGVLMKKVLKSIGLDIGDIYYSATVKCSNSQEISNRLAETLPCKKHLINELRILKPRLILGFGKTTYDLMMSDKEQIEEKEFIDSEAFANHSGKILSFHGVDIVFTYHPRDLLMDPSLKKVTWNHLKSWIPEIEAIKSQTT